jgi:Acetyltransferase (GNAT) domain
MAYKYRLYNSIYEAPQADWVGLRTNGDDLYMDPRFIAVAEKTITEAQRFWSVLIYDAGNRPVASANLFLYQLDGALLCPPRPRRVLRAIRHVWPGCMRFRVLFCGLPFSAGQSHLRIATGADAREVLRQLDLVTTRLAAQSRAEVIICKEFADEDLSYTDYFCEIGYVRGPSLPMNYFASGFGNFDKFCAALRSHYRYKIHRSQRKFANSGFRVSHFQGAEALPYYTDEVHRLYLAVRGRAEVQFETLPAEFFRQLAAQCGDSVRLTAVFKGPRIVAFSWGILLGHAYQNVFVGLDYELNNEYDSYFNLMASDLDRALRLGAQEIQMGQTADDFKSRLGCYGRPRYVYAKGTRWFTAKPLRWTRHLVMPPPPQPPVRDLYRETKNESASSYCPLALWERGRK